MLGTIIGAIIVGAIIGALGRLLLPGKQNISLVVTILIGIVANLIVGWGLYFLFGYNNNNGGIAWIGILIGAIVAALLIVLYGRMRGGSRTV
ncbi:MAG TPA: GlsB/YeaQ/YmgE family stress response membrane protein [Lapillicoccus sp.]|jgi:uncharacterized membrane protein YeaQ/YmgE (transglycosylase-associated protein family)|uniref:GlsB/YeaQ/YmgE family stress response membrane protein n=1 Tax=Lapillicoccus sp. TaxID=1909287 RepID=UPI002F94B5A7